MKRPIAKKKTKSQPADRKLTGPLPIIVAHPEMVDAAEELLKKGYSVEMVCETLGIARNTFYLWLKQGEEGTDTYPEAYADFHKRITAARAYAKQRIVDVIVSAAYGTPEKAGDWRAMAWLGERMFPQDFGVKDQVEHKHSGTVEVEHKAIVFNLPTVMAQPRLVEGKTIEPTHEQTPKEKEE